MTRGDEVTGVTGLVSKRMAWREDPFLSLRALMVSMEELGAGDQSHLVGRHLVTIPAHQGHVGELLPGGNVSEDVRCESREVGPLKTELATFNVRHPGRD